MSPNPFFTGFSVATAMALPLWGVIILILTTVT